MSRIKERLNVKIEELRRNNPKAGFIRLFMTLLANIIIGSWRVMLAKYYLRSATLGKLVSINGKPVFENAGLVVLNDEVRIWSNINRSKIFVDAGAKLEIGKNTRVNGAHISASCDVYIGENVQIAPYVVIMDNDFHDIDDHFADGAMAPVVIGDGAWLALRSTVLKGVTIGEGAVVAAGSVVTKNVPPYTLVGGIPAKIIRSLKEVEEPVLKSVNVS